MNYPRNLWYVGSWTKDIAPGRPVRAEILGELIVVYRGDSGRLVALEDRCVHRLAPLSLGRCEAGDTLRCMYHGLLFDADGKVVKIPGQDRIPAKARVKAYPVAERHGWVWIWMGEPDQADAALIPPAHRYDDPDYTFREGVMDFACEASLVHDNLLDLSHLAYLHQATLNVSQDDAEQLPDVTTIERGVRFRKWNRPQPGSDFETYADWIFVMPGVSILQAGKFPAGTAKRVDRGPIDIDQSPGDRFFSSQSVIPTRKGRCRYFFSIGVHREFGGEALRDAMFEGAIQAFQTEDAIMTEAQQQALDADPHARFMPVANDKGVVLYNRLIRKAVRNEAGLAA